MKNTNLKINLLMKELNVSIAKLAPKKGRAIWRPRLFNVALTNLAKLEIEINLNKAPEEDLNKARLLWDKGNEVLEAYYNCFNKK